MRSRPASAVSITTSSTSPSSRSSSAVRSTFASAAGCSSRSAGSARARTRPRMKASESLLASSTHDSPRAAHQAPVSSRLIPAASSGRIRQPAPFGHPEQRAAPGRGGEAVEDRLGLVGRGVPGGEPAAARRGSAHARAVAHVPRPRLQVPGARGRRDVLGLQRDVQPAAERRARGLVGSADSGRRP